MMAATCGPFHQKPRIGFIFLLNFARLARAAVAWAPLAILTGAWCAGAAQAQCLKDAREVKFGAGSARLVSYLCKAAGAADAAPVRIGFYRLSEAAAASVLAGKAWPEVERVLGKAKLIDTAPGREAANLFKQFGKTEKQEEGFHFQAVAAAGGKGSEKLEIGGAGKTITYLTYPDTAGLTGQPIALPETDATIKTTAAWGPEFRFYYRNFPQCTSAAAFECTILWRFLTVEDVSQFEARSQHAHQALGLDPGGGETIIDGQAVTPTEPQATPGSEPLPLIQYLTRDGWPEDFITIVGGYSPCGGVDFQYYPRQMVLDVAVIENAGTRPVAIGELLGAANATMGLRPEQASRTAAGGALAPASGPVGTLAPGQRVAAPLRIGFVAPPGLSETFAATAPEAQKFYALIEQQPPGGLIVEPREGDPSMWEGMAPPLQKTRESFLPPEAPRMAPYTYGPEIALKGLVVAGARVAITEESANFLELTAGGGYGSCPFLYAYDGTAGEWVRYGKVIDRADAESKRMTQEIRLAQPMTRFRLSEEELEMSMIDRAALIVKLKSGTSRVVETADDILARSDGRERTILAGQTVEFSFQIPADIQKADIEETYLSITGYYRRYGGMKISRLAAP